MLSVWPLACQEEIDQWVCKVREAMWAALKAKRTQKRGNCKKIDGDQVAKGYIMYP